MAHSRVSRQSLDFRRLFIVSGGAYVFSAAVELGMKSLNKKLSSRLIEKRFNFDVVH